MMREYQVRICEGLRVKFPGPTRQNPTTCSAPACLLPPTADILRGKIILDVPAGRKNKRQSGWVCRGAWTNSPPSSEIAGGVGRGSNATGDAITGTGAVIATLA